MLYTDNYSLKKPQYGETADVADINYNADKIDGIMWDNRRISVAMYDTSETYNTDALVGHEDSNGHIHVYKCLADNVTGTWDNTKWEMTDLASEIEDVRENAGTDVEANPSGTATDTLEKLRVDSTIYAIPKDVVSKEAEGNPIEITDGASAPLVKCETAITGSQDLHGYDKPWVGGAGKNKLPNALLNDQSSITFEDVVMTVEGNGFHFQGTATNNGGRLNLTTKHITLPAGTYVFSYSRNIIDAFVESGNNIIASLSNPVFTLEESTEVYVGFNVVSERIYNETSLVQIESGSTPTTFAPYSNICPITAYTEGEIEVRGKNLFDKSAKDTSNGYVANAYIRSNNTIQSDSDCYISEYTAVEENTDYIIENVSGNNVGYAFYDEEKNYISGGGYGIQWGVYGNATFTTPANAKYVRVSVIIAKEDVTQLEKGTTTTTYEPYTSTTHTTTFPSAIYRGSEDVVNGSVLANVKKVVFDGSSDEEWSYELTGSGYINFYISVSDARTRQLSDTLKCNLFEVNQDGVYAQENKCFISNAGNFNATCGDLLGIDNVSDFKTWLASNNLEIAYELATPTTSSVTPTNLPIKSLSGYNHIESSTGEMEVEYITSKYQPLVNLMKNMVVANPSEDATVTLEKLKVNDTVYSLPSGGGGGGESVRASNTITVSGGVS